MAKKTTAQNTETLFKDDSDLTGKLLFVPSPVVTKSKSTLRSRIRTAQNFTCRLAGNTRLSQLSIVEQNGPRVVITTAHEEVLDQVVEIANNFPQGKNPEALTARIDGIRDQAQMLTSVTDGAKNVDEVTTRIEALFTDDGLGAAGVITCSSVHRAKGLEAERVFVLQATLRNDSREEQNICYVAVTRAKSSLVYVTGKAA